MTSVEQAQFADIVTITNKTSDTLEFIWDSVVYNFKPKAYRHLPRHIAQHGIEMFPLTVNEFTGLAETSKFEITESQVLTKTASKK